VTTTAVANQPTPPPNHTHYPWCDPTHNGQLDGCYTAPQNDGNYTIHTSRTNTLNYTDIDGRPATINVRTIDLDLPGRGPVIHLATDAPYADLTPEEAITVGTALISHARQLTGPEARRRAAYRHNGRNRPAN
jgi:hypothetical protein